jgi:hypothetical protein
MVGKTFDLRTARFPVKGHLQTVVAQTVTPEHALRAMTADVKALLPK